MVPDELELYGDARIYYLQVRPGLTGLWQISGRNDVDYERRVSLDAWYVRNWTLWYDILILFRTLLVVPGKRQRRLLSRATPPLAAVNVAMKSLSRSPWIRMWSFSARSARCAVAGQDGVDDRLVLGQRARDSAARPQLQPAIGLQPVVQLACLLGQIAVVGLRRRATCGTVRWHSSRRRRRRSTPRGAGLVRLQQPRALRRRSAAGPPGRRRHPRAPPSPRSAR